MANPIPRATLEIMTQPTKGITIVLEPRGTNKTIIFDAGEDYNEETLRTVKSYAVETIKDGKATYQINSNINASNIDLSIGDNPAGISDNAPGGDPAKVFINSVPDNARSYFINLSEPEFTNVSVVKGKAFSNPDQVAYIPALQQLEVQAVEGRDNTGLPLQLGTALKNVNAYYPTTDNEGFVYINPELVVPENQSNVGRSRVQTTLGVYQRRLNGNQPGQSTLVQQDMQYMGLQLPLKASGELYVPKFGPNQTTDDPAAQIAAARGAALAPGLARLGLRVPVTDITPTQVFNNDFNGVRKDNPYPENSNFPELAVEAISSYGSYNNWIAPFDGIERLLQMPALAIQVGAIALIVVGIAEIMRGITGKDTYVEQVRAGFISFFGLSSPIGRYDSASFTTAVATAIISSRMINETGWYSTVVRGFIKNLFQEISRGVYAGAAPLNIANAESNTGILNRTGVDIYSDVIPGDVVGGAAKIIELFFNSKLVGFTNMLAEIGEGMVVPSSELNGQPPTIMPRKKGIGSTPYSDHGLTKNQKSFIDELVDGTRDETSFSDAAARRTPNLSTTIMKDRLNNNSRKGSMGVKPSVLGSGITPSMYLLPNSIKKAAVLASGDVKALTPLTELNAKTSITKIEVEEFENILEASYMPFYFQDMRTDEIISFHAFLTSMQDSFRSEYNSETSFGRVEPTHIYKNTSRDMGLEFVVVATNPQDHDEMWFKINKLITFAYPQYTKGRALQNTTTNQKFIQPYSQLIGASPLVRMRVGDVWKSNYSKFNIMRLFGLGKSEFNLDADDDATKVFQEVNGGGTFRPDQIMYENKLANMLKFNLAVNDQFLLSYSKETDNRVFGELDQANPTARELKAPNLIPGLYKFKVKTPNIPATASLPIVEYQLELVDNPDGKTYILRYANVDALGSNELDLAQQLGAAFQARFSAFENSPTLDLWQRSVAYSSFSTKIMVDYEWLKTQYPGESYVNATVTGSLSNAVDKVKNFFNGSTSGGAASGGAASDTNANPIIQSFEENKGRGIAGFISQIELDWRDSTWETEWNSSRNSSRAPMLLKINMKFLPIHDITPGIDSDGFITAPVYPVGRYSNATSAASADDTATIDAINAAVTEIKSER